MLLVKINGKAKTRCPSLEVQGWRLKPWGLWAPLVLLLLLPADARAGGLRTETRGLRVELASDPDRPN